MKITYECISRAAPPPSRNVPAHAPPTSPAPAMGQPQQPSMFQQMAATAGGVAVGSAVVRNLLHNLNIDLEPPITLGSYYLSLKSVKLLTYTIFRKISIPISFQWRPWQASKCLEDGLVLSDVINDSVVFVTCFA